MSLVQLHTVVHGSQTFFPPKCSKDSEARGGQSPGLKLEVQAALRALRDQLLAEKKEEVRDLRKAPEIITCSVLWIDV